MSGIATGAVACAIALPPARVRLRLLQTYHQPSPLVLKIDSIYGLSSGVARTPVFGVRGSSLAKTGNIKGRRLPSGSEARVSGRTADLKGGGLRYARLNPAWESGYTRDELKAKRFFDFAKPDDVGATQKA